MKDISFVAHLIREGVKECYDTQCRENGCFNCRFYPWYKDGCEFLRVAEYLLKNGIDIKL